MKTYLVGYMYSGKTTVGHQLAGLLGCPFIDLDRAIEQRFRTTIPILFSRYGEQAFRTIERQTLLDTATAEHAVISTGGGTPCFFDNMEWMNAHGCTVFLEAPLPLIIQRAENSKKQRPLLAQMQPHELAAHISNQLAQRLSFYRQARLRFPADADSVRPLADLIAREANHP